MALFTPNDLTILSFRDDLSGFTADHIRRLPNSPEQNGTDAILKFYAILPSGKGTVPRSVLATIFVVQQKNIFSVDSELQGRDQSIKPGERVALSPEQKRNNVSLSLKNFKAERVSSFM